METNPTQYLLISNKGEIDPMAFELIGASTKVGDETKIGMFGSGINYAIAFLIRNNIEFHAFSGEKEIKITTKVEDFRGKCFERILLNDIQTSFTTDMGKDWECWFVIREIYSNSIDEGEEKIEKSEEIKGIKDTTRFYIQITPAVQEVLDNWELYFSEARNDLLHETEKGIKIYSGGNDLVVYRKGIRVMLKKDERSCFHYDFPEIDINESRIISSEWTLKSQLIQFWYRNATVDLIKRLNKNMRDTYEELLDWGEYGYTMGENWEKALENRYVVERETAGYYEEMVKANNPIQLPKQLTDAIIEKQGVEKHVAGKEGGKGIKRLETTEKEKYMLKKLDEFCKECEYEINYPIAVVQFTKKGLLAMANCDDKEIYLSQDAFDSFELLIKAAIEENEHINSGLDDNTRAFQNHFINLFLQEKLNRFAYTI